MKYIKYKKIWNIEIDRYQYFDEEYSLIEYSNSYQIINDVFYYKIMNLFPGVFEIDSIKKRKYFFNHKSRMCYEIEYAFHKYSWEWSKFVVPVDYIENNLRHRKINKLIYEK